MRRLLATRSTPNSYAMKRILICLTTLSVACASGESGTGDSATAVAPATPNVVTITASDYSYAAPDTIPAGMTTFHLVATAGLHHATLVRVTEGKSFEDFSAAMQAMKPTDMPPTWIVPVGGPNPPAIGDTAIVTHDMTPGLHVIVCMVDTPDHVPHMAKGMVRPLMVVPTSAPAVPAPVSDVSMTLVDYGFDISPALTAGEHVIKVTNTAQQPHEFFLARLDSGKTMADLGAWGATYKGEMPARSLGGVASMAPGETGYVHVRLTPGNYALLCFVPDAKDGKPHLEHGMAKEFTIQ